MNTFTIDGVEFVLDLRPGKDRDVSTTNRFVLVKNDRCLNHYREWTGPKPKTIFEVGMFEGGSLVLMDKLFSPDLIVGLDLRGKPIEPLEEYAANNPQLKTYYGRSQDKPETLQAARQNFPNGIDLVVDDASHLYEQTRATFEMIFPLVKSGGKYIIEDWAWGHLAGRQAPGSVWYNKPAMSNLISQIVMLSARYPVLEKVEVYKELVIITKGKGALPKDALDMKEVLRGREFSLV